MQLVVHFVKINKIDTRGRKEKHGKEDKSECVYQQDDFCKTGNPISSSFKVHNNSLWYFSAKYYIIVIVMFLLTIIKIMIKRKKKTLRR